MRFRIVRQYINYVHAGTSAFMHLTDAAGRKCAVCTTYREKQVGFVRRRFEADTVLDSMRELISDHIVAGMTDRILAGESVDWCGQAKLSEAGITPARGPCAGHLVPYRHIQGVRMHNRKFEVLRLGDRHPFLRLDPGAENFGPAAKLLGRLAESSGAAQDDSTGAVSEQRRRAA